MRPTIPVPTATPPTVITAAGAAGHTPPPVPLRVGQAVHVNTHTAWIPATVTHLMGGSRVGVRTQPPAGYTPFAGTLARWVVQPAAGAWLCPISGVHPGHAVLAHNGQPHTVAHVRRLSTGAWLLTYRDGNQVVLPAAAILRLARDHQPARTPHPRRAR